MTETEFLQQATALFDRIEAAVEEANVGVDSERAGNVLTLEADSGEQVVVNLHAPTQQVWLASRQGGLHFTMVDGQWSCTRNAADFWAELSKAVSFIAEEQVQLTA